MIDISSGWFKSFKPILLQMCAQIDNDNDMSDEAREDMMDRLNRVKDRLMQEENLANILTSLSELDNIVITIEMPISEAFDTLTKMAYISSDNETKQLAVIQIKYLLIYAMLTIVKKFMDEDDHEETEKVTSQLASLEDILNNKG